MIHHHNPRPDQSWFANEKYPFEMWNSTEFIEKVLKADYTGIMLEETLGEPIFEYKTSISSFFPFDENITSNRKYSYREISVNTNHFRPINIIKKPLLAKLQIFQLQQGITVGELLAIAEKKIEYEKKKNLNEYLPIAMNNFLCKGRDNYGRNIFKDMLNIYFPFSL